MDGENWTFWLNVTNIALGVIVLLALLVVLGAVVSELLARRSRKAREMASIDAELLAMLHAGPHSLSTPGLGLTMADGGEPVAPSESEGSEKKPRGK
jgi:hypothetical protein